MIIEQNQQSKSVVFFYIVVFKIIVSVLAQQRLIELRMGKTNFQIHRSQNNRRANCKQQCIWNNLKMRSSKKKERVDNDFYLKQ